MKILQRLSAIALCIGILYVDKGLCVGNCALAYSDGTEITTSEWSFGLYLDSIEDTTAVGTVILNLTATYTSDISSVSNDSTSGLLFVEPVLSDSSFTLTLTDDFASYEEYETLERIKITVTFTCTRDTRSIEIYQPITDTNNHYPEFQDAPYSYTLPMPFPSNFPLQLFGSISARDIDLTNTNISFTLNSSDSNSDGFTASWLSQDSEDTKLHYAQVLTTSLLSFESNVTFSIFATDNGDPTLTSETTITIVVDEDNSAVVTPLFTYPLYIADLTGSTAEEVNGSTIEFNQGDITLSQGADSTVEFALTSNSGNYENNFGLATSVDYTTITVSLVNASDELMSESFELFTLSATKPNATSIGYTVLHISLPGLLCTTCTATTTADATEETATATSVSNSTEESTLSTTDETSSANTTEVTTTANSSEVTTDANTSDATTTTDNTEVATDTSSTEVTTITECVTVTTEECVCDCSTTTTIDSETTTVSNTTESTIADNTETTVTSSAVTEASTTATASLAFPKTLYRFDKDSTFVGTIMTEVATATNANGTIVYSTVIDDENLNERILIDSRTAQLNVTAVINPGVYTFQIVAEIEDLSLSTTATIVLSISSITECNGEIVFGYALQIIELEEESAHENIVPLDDNDCNYTIYSQTPDQGWFYIDNNTLNSEIIDRESSYFSDMTVAQVRVIIDMTCANSSTSNDSSTRSKRDTEYEVITGNIQYVPTRMVVVAIITDINDNAPVWKSDTPSIIGFPGYDLAQLIQVPYAYNFTASDADIGDNAVITYSLTFSSDVYFYINPTTGTLYTEQGIYPTDMLNFTINASDGTWTTSVIVTVRALESSNVAIYYVNGAVLEDVEDLLTEYNNNTGYWMRYLTTAVISESDAPSTTSERVSRSMTRKKRSTDVNTLLRVVLYGINNSEPLVNDALIDVGPAGTTNDVESSAALDRKELIKSLISLADDVEVEWDVIEKTTLDAVVLQASTSSTVAYWVTIIVLSVLLLLILIAVPTIYYIYFRRRREPSDNSKLAYEDLENENGDSISETKPKLRPTLTLNGSEAHTTTSSTEGRKKSVAFKDIVDEIEDIKL